MARSDEFNPAQSYQLDANGLVRIGGPAIFLRAPDDVPLAKLDGDSKLMMDLLLKGYTVRRQVGSDSVRVTSLGAAQEQGTFTDQYGRTWLIRSWPVPYDDSVISALCLPTPGGYDLLLAHVSSGARTVVLHQLELLSNYLYLTFTGTLSRWQEYLAQPITRPAVFNGLQIDVQSDRQVHVRSRGFDFTATKDLVPLSHDSVLAVLTSYYRSDSKVVWDVSGLTVTQSSQQPNGVQIVRIAAPLASMPESTQVRWHKMQDAEYPFDGKVATNDGKTMIQAVVGASGSPEGANSAEPQVEYVLSVVGEGDQAQQPMAARLALARRSFQQLEH